MKYLCYILFSITILASCKSGCEDKYEPQFTIDNQSQTNSLDHINSINPKNILVWLPKQYSPLGYSNSNNPIPFYGSGNEMKFVCTFTYYPSDSIRTDTFLLSYKSTKYFISTDCGYGYKISEVKLTQQTFHVADSMKFNSETMKLSIWN